ncbi:hypothetical protein WKI40_05140, partial [Kosakonia sacchari]|uniref:hypothetical protein n=1 Tax=Kosakonia sacchari TaxID=1158459 RepID=UPI0030C471ED
QKAGFRFWGYGLSIELRSIIRRKRLTPSGPARQARCSTPDGVSPGPGTTYSENPAYGWVFVFGIRTLHRTAFDYSPQTSCLIQN